MSSQQLNNEITNSIIRDLILELDTPNKVETFLSGFHSRENYTTVNVIEAFNNLCEELDIPSVQDHLNKVVGKALYQTEAVK